MAELEHWRDIKGYVGLYEISDKGRVASFSRKYAHKETIILVPNISDRGYALVTLCKNVMCTEERDFFYPSLTLINKKEWRKELGEE